MIFISTADMIFPEGWPDEQKHAVEFLNNCINAEERKDALDSTLTSIWKDLRNNMADLSRDKCWYCESAIIREDLAIDHFRPKGAIFEDPAHGGYWWLAFAFSNFRLTCKYCNEIRVDKIENRRGGKATHFPLLAGSRRATAENRDLSQEMIVILDPIEAADVDYLVFRIDAYAVPKPEPSEDPIGFERAKRTISILNLNQARIRRGRGQICNQVMEGIERCDLAYRSLMDRRAESAEPLVVHAAFEAYKAAVQRLAGFTYYSSPYAGAARSILREARTEQRAWVDVLLAH
jgi:uncharacterized protein (TIGR02646 family)